VAKSTPARKSRQTKPRVRARAAPGDKAKQYLTRAEVLQKWEAFWRRHAQAILAANPGVLSEPAPTGTDQVTTRAKRSRGRPVIDTVTSTQNAIALVAGVILSERDGKKTREAFDQVAEAKFVSNSRVQHALYQFWRNDPDLRQRWSTQNDLDIRELIESLKDENGGPDDAALRELETLFSMPRTK